MKLHIDFDNNIFIQYLKCNIIYYFTPKYSYLFIYLTILDLLN